jgi:hypothetical protein
MSQSAPERDKRTVATRSFRTASGSAIVAEIHEPIVVGPDQWKCEFTISGFPEKIEAHAYGVDSMQALEMSFEGVRVYLERTGEVLTCHDGEPGALGISRRIPDSYGVAIERHLAKLVDDEVTRLVEADVKAKGRPWPPSKT